MLKQHLISDADILGSANKAQADFFLWKNPNTAEPTESGSGTGSPASRAATSTTSTTNSASSRIRTPPPTDKYCWIKADPTFDGLRQIINEPEDRVYIGAHAAEARGGAEQRHAVHRPASHPQER